MTSQPPIAHERLAEIRGRLAALDVGAAELREIAGQLLADSNYWYMRADYWREGYRLAKGLTDDELNAQIAIEEVMKPHVRPCRFPNSPDCTCDTADSGEPPNPPYDMPAAIDSWWDL